MEKMILAFPTQFAQGYEAGRGVGKEYIEKKFKNIVICGMGGSALPAGILSMSAEEIGLKIPIYTHRNYGLPLETTKESLVIVISYSGNTKEALSSYKEAKERDLFTIAITVGGLLGNMSKESNTPVALIPAGLPPRLALGYQFSALIAICENVGLVKPQEKNLEELAKSLDVKKYSEKAKTLSENIGELTPLIYSSQKYKNLAYILKIQFNENTKRHAFCNYFPEVNHNEMVGFSTKDNFTVLILRFTDDDNRIKKHMDLTAKMVRENGFSVEFIDIEGKEVYDRIFNAVLFGNWFSYYVAIKNGVDPISIKIIEKFKESL